MSSSSERDVASSALLAVKTAFGGSYDKEIREAVEASASLVQLISKLKSIRNNKLRAQAQTRLLEVAEIATSVLNDQLVDLMEWVKEDPLLAQTGDAAVATATESYPNVQAAAQRGKATRNNKRGYMNRIKANWGAEVAESAFVQGIYQLPENRLRALGEASVKEVSFKVARERICAAYIDRLSTTKQGIRSNPDYMNADFAHADDQTLSMTSDHEKKRRALNLTITSDGWVVPRTGNRDRVDAVASSSAHPPTAGSGASSSRSPYQLRSSDQAMSRSTSPSARQLGSSGSALSLPRASPRSAPTPLRSSEQATSPTTSPQARQLRSGSNMLGLPSRPRQESITTSVASTPSRYAPSTASPFSDVRSSVMQSPPVLVAKNIYASKQCKCRTNHVSDTFTVILMDPQERPSAQRIQSALGEVERAGVKDNNGPFYCYSHTQDFCRIVGLRNHKGGHAELLNRLLTTAQNRRSLDAFKTSLEHHYWFVKASRGPVPADELGPYRFFPRGDMLGRNCIRTLSSTTACKEVAEALGISNLYKDWVKRGTINTTKIFGWWKDKAIAGAVSEEFDMYLWHLREINGRSNLGWQREQLFSVTQQLMRQDVGYWLAYALLREDRLLWLISYPYYCKNTKAGDNTAFRHIDLNINNMADGKGISQIQGSLSLTDEDESNCTIVVPGMHNHIKAWRNRLKYRGGLGEGFIQKITDHTLTSKDLEDFGTAWEKVPCEKFGVRITRPEIPHGSTGPSKSVRQTMLPWYVGILQDHQSLEVEASGTHEQLSESHRHQTAPPRSPSGYANMYGAIPYKFPAGVQLDGLGPISDALVGRMRWNDPEVQYEVRQLLKMDAGHIQEYLEAWRKNATQRFVAAWKKEQELEKFYFSDRAWGRRDKLKPAVPPPADFTREDTEMEEDEEGAELEAP